jgi:hypothetical protein
MSTVDLPRCRRSYIPPLLPLSSLHHHTRSTDGFSSLRTRSGVGSLGRGCRRQRRFLTQLGMTLREGNWIQRTCSVECPLALPSRPAHIFVIRQRSRFDRRSLLMGWTSHATISCRSASSAVPWETVNRLLTSIPMNGNALTPRGRFSGTSPTRIIARSNIRTERPGDDAGDVHQGGCTDGPTTAHQ